LPAVISAAPVVSMSPISWGDFSLADLAHRGLRERQEPAAVAVAADQLGVLRRALGELRSYW
jgi:hypothetical protein